MSDRLISCVLPPGLGSELQDRLFREHGLTRVDVHTARGFMGSDPERHLNRVEREILSVVTGPERADEIFEWIYREGKVAELRGRFLYMVRLSKATELDLPSDIPLEPEG